MEQKIYTMNFCRFNDSDEKIEYQTEDYYSMMKKGKRGEELSMQKGNSFFLQIVDSLKKKKEREKKNIEKEAELISTAYVLDFWNVKYELQYYLIKNVEQKYNIKIVLFHENKLADSEIHYIYKSREVSINEIYKYARNFVFPSNLKEEY